MSGFCVREAFWTSSTPVHAAALAGCLNLLLRELLVLDGVHVLHHACKSYPSIRLQQSKESGVCS